MTPPSNGSSIRHICGKRFENTGQTTHYDILSLKLRLEIRVTVTKKQLPCAHSANLWCRIPMSNNMGVMLEKRFFLNLSPELRVKVTVTPKWYDTPRSQVHLHTNFVISTSNNICSRHNTDVKPAAQDILSI